MVLMEHHGFVYYFDGLTIMVHHHQQNHPEWTGAAL
jgi:hypothetical protein